MRAKRLLDEAVEELRALDAQITRAKYTKDDIEEQTTRRLNLLFERVAYAKDDANHSMIVGYCKRVCDEIIALREPVKVLEKAESLRQRITALQHQVESGGGDTDGLGTV